MLNISENNIGNKVNESKYSSFGKIMPTRSGRVLARFLVGLMILMLAMMFLPWTQNIRARGYVTSLQPDKRPQTMQTVIAGRIEKWYVQEGDYVQLGDTIVQISEIKDDYFDPQLLSRQADQIENKQQAVASYEDKVDALEQQIQALQATRLLKIEQTRTYRPPLRSWQ
jgi:multidrug resistance efflux pump